MKFRITLVLAALAVGLSPALGFCAEGQEQSGSWFALIFYGINFAAFVYILVRFVGPIATKFFRERATQIRDSIQVSETGFRDARNSAEQAAAQLAHLEEEKSRLLREMREETQREVARIRELGQQSVQRIRRDAELTANSLAGNGRRTIQAHLAAAAVRMARELIVNNLESGDQSRLLRDFLDTVGREARS